MKIVPPRSTPRPRALQQAARGNRPSAFAAEIAPHGFLESEALAAPQACAPSSELLGLQEAKQKTPQQRGHKLLSSLEALYASTLMEEDATYGLQELAKTLQSPSVVCTDPQLQQILDEIEQRAAIELAKRACKRGPF